MFELGIESIELVVALASSGMGLGSGVIRLVEWVGDVYYLVWPGAVS
jgi:hypothetical protein